MMFSRSRKDDDVVGPDGIGPHRPGGATPSSTWISRALLENSLPLAEAS